MAGDRYTVAEPTRYLAGGRYPDLLVAFDVDPAAYAASNGYIIAEQGKPPDGSLQGYSAVLDLYLRWEAGELVFYDPATDRPILTYEDQRARADREREVRAAAEARADTAEARVRELEARLRQQNP